MMYSAVFAFLLPESANFLSLILFAQEKAVSIQEQNADIKIKTAIMIKYTVIFKLITPLT